MRRNRSKEYREAQRLLAGMKRDGVPLAEKSVMEAVEHPHWERVFETAELTALGEERGAVMVTGPAGPGTTG